MRHRSAPERGFFQHLTSSYYYKWRRKIKDEKAGAGGLLELIPGKPVDAASGVRISLGANLAVEVDRGFGPFTLRAVVETLGGFSPTTRKTALPTAAI
jgi:hypothetical protein